MRGSVPHSICIGLLPSQAAPRQRGDGAAGGAGEGRPSVDWPASRTRATDRPPAASAQTEAMIAIAAPLPPPALSSSSEAVGESVRVGVARPLHSDSASSHSARHRPSGSPARRHSSRTAWPGGSVLPLR